MIEDGFEGVGLALAAVAICLGLAYVIVRRPRGDGAAGSGPPIALGRR